jgi:hypothetical protein
VSERSDEEIRKSEAEERLNGPLRELAANILRVVRGAGAPERLGGQMNDCLDAFAKDREAFGHWPAPWTLADILKIENEAEVWRERSGLDSPDVQRWSEDGTFDRAEAIHAICKGALQMTASRLLDQKTQAAAVEHEMYGGIRDLEEARERRRALPRAQIAPVKGIQRNGKKRSPPTRK